MKKSNFRALTALALASLFATAALAAPPAPPPPAVQTAMSQGLKLEASFPAAGGLTGWVLSQGPSTNILVYTPANGDVALAGTLFDADGVNLNDQYLEKYAPKPDYTKLWKELETAAWVGEGPAKGAKSVVYAFEDANCSFCDLAAKAFRPYIKAGLQVRWVPVAFLTPESMVKAAELLGAKDPVAAIAKKHATFGQKATGTQPVSAELQAKVDANGKLMRDYGFNGTPAIFYKDSKGIVRAVTGMPRLSELPVITGMPAQPQTDPALARFR